MMNRIENEKKTAGIMVRLYCRRYEGNEKLYTDCSDLLKYAVQPDRGDKASCS